MPHVHSYQFSKLSARKLAVISIVAALSSPSFGCAGQLRVRMHASGQRVPIAQPALYPETIETNPWTKRFLVSSVREGAVYEVARDGSAKKVIDDERLTSILGIAVDASSGRLLVTNGDIGAGMKHSARGARKEAGVGVYDLRTGRAMQYVDLTPLLPEGEHLVNGITVDHRGNAYVTDSFSPVIYKVEPSGRASVFLKDPEFQGKGVILNGIVYHPRGFLLVVNKSTGNLYRVPVDRPSDFKRVIIDESFRGGDGLTLVGENSLVVVANKTPTNTANAAFVLRTESDWSTADVVETVQLGDIYPTTCASLDGRLYLLSSHLDELLSATDGSRDGVLSRARRAEIRELGTISGQRRRRFEGTAGASGR